MFDSCCLYMGCKASVGVVINQSVAHKHLALCLRSLVQLGILGEGGFTPRLPYTAGTFTSTCPVPRNIGLFDMKYSACFAAAPHAACIPAGGQILSAVVGVCIRLALDKVQWLANPLGMALALLVMQVTGTTHPPGGATALIACSTPQMAPWYGFQMVLAVALGSFELLAVALVASNLHKNRSYPTFWW